MMELESRMRNTIPRCKALGRKPSEMAACVDYDYHAMLNRAYMVDRGGVDMRLLRLLEEQLDKWEAEAAAAAHQGGHPGRTERIAL